MPSKLFNQIVVRLLDTFIHPIVSRLYFADCINIYNIIGDE